MNDHPAIHISAVLRWWGRVSRRTLHFRDVIFHSWSRYRHWAEIVAIAPRLQMPCNLWDDLQHGIWWCGDDYEFRETRFLKRLLRPGMVFLDVGENVGYYSLLAASRVAPDGAVYAFEPVAAQHAAHRSRSERFDACHP